MAAILRFQFTAADDQRRTARARLARHRAQNRLDEVFRVIFLLENFDAFAQAGRARLLVVEGRDGVDGDGQARLPAAVMDAGRTRAGASGDGCITTRRPGTWANHACKACECCAPCSPPRLMMPRMVMPGCPCPPVMCDHLAAWLTTASIAYSMKSSRG